MFLIVTGLPYIRDSPETVGSRSGPESGIGCGFRGFDKDIYFQERVYAVNRTGFDRIEPLVQVMWTDLRRIVQSHRNDNIAQCSGCLFLEPIHPFRLVRDDQTALS